MTRTVTVGDLSPEQSRVHRVRETIHRDGATPGSALDGLAAIVADDTWRHVTDAQGQPFSSFQAFVETKPPFGLGINEGELRKVIALRHPHEGNTEIRERMEHMRAQVDRLLREEIKPMAQHGAIGRGRNRNGGTNSIENANTADYVVARLKRDDPALAERVVQGELTANAAARAAGIRRPRIVLSTPERIAASLRRHLTAEQLAELRGLL